MPFITFEGIDGCGKSTLMSRLAEYLGKQGFKTDLTREPGGTPLAEELRSLVLKKGDESPVPRAELLIYEAARAQHVEKRIKPALEKGLWVLSDRFFDSSLAFQGGGRSIKLTDVDWLNHFATGGLRPDLTVLLDCPVEVGFQRRKSRENASTVSKPDRLESEKRSFHEVVRASFLAIARSELNRFLVLDAIQSPDQLFTDLVGHIKKKGWLTKS